MRIAITIDIDMALYDTGRFFDEMGVIFPEVRRCLEDLPGIRTTWFLRIDRQIEVLYGSPLYVFEKHAQAVDWLRGNAHEIGWHHHAYAKDGPRWRQETGEAAVCGDIGRYGRIALDAGLRLARMGWGFHTNKTMKAVHELGFPIDSSAIPRPRYRWSPNACDWADTPRHPYRPSVKDYRVAGDPHLELWEVPMTTVALPLATDTEPGVVRYIELGYDNVLFKRALAAAGPASTAVLIFHPYKLVKTSGGGGSASFDSGLLRTNLEAATGCGARFITLSETVDTTVKT